MDDLTSILDKMRRPPQLIRAARIAADDYERQKHLPRLLSVKHMPQSRDALVDLAAMECKENKLREIGDDRYSLIRHVDLLTSIFGEARIHRALAPEEGA